MPDYKATAKITKSKNWNGGWVSHDPPRHKTWLGWASDRIRATQIATQDLIDPETEQGHVTSVEEVKKQL